ncbi:hypothetical protein GCM10010430_50460 [Kitasatospora cystarginea]|uniref:Uncharacterized protein n=1 Tax=Kitasatospora cystarginea TaxID=58350 RepID=A0ABP5RF90_9ACTN
MPLATTKEIRVLAFLDTAEVDPITYDRVYYPAPRSRRGRAPTRCYAARCSMPTGSASSIARRCGPRRAWPY